MHRFNEPTIQVLPGIAQLEAGDPITAVDHLITISFDDGYWINSHGHARTDTMTDVSPSGLN